MDWPIQIKVVSRRRAHIVGYIGKLNLALSWLKAQRLGMDLTVCPSVHARLGKLWQERLGNGYIPRSTRSAHEFFQQLTRMGKNIKDSQQLLFLRFGWKIRIKTLQKWIMQDRYRRNPTDIHYWSVGW